MMATQQSASKVDDAVGNVVQLPVKHISAAGSATFNPEENQASDAAKLAREYERFQLQVQLDIENERELLYKSLLVVELLAFVFVLREVLIRWLA
jgi:hypothetical protein